MARSLASIVALALLQAPIAADAFVTSNQPRLVGSHTWIPLTRTSRCVLLHRTMNRTDEFPIVFTRRNVLHSWAAVSAALILMTLNHESSLAQAAYGDGTNIVLPSYVDFLIEKNAQADPSTFLYKGADREVQLKRIAAAVSRIKTIPLIAQGRKWSEVQGVLIGPLGTLIQTMNQISGANKEALQITAQVKSSLLEIGRGASSKSEDVCVAASITTLENLDTFVKVAF